MQSKYSVNSGKNSVVKISLLWKEESITVENESCAFDKAMKVAETLSPCVELLLSVRAQREITEMELRKEYCKSLIQAMNDPKLSSKKRQQLHHEFESNLQCMNRNHKGAEHLRSARGKGRSRKVAPTVKK